MTLKDCTVKMVDVLYEHMTDDHKSHKVLGKWFGMKVINKSEIANFIAVCYLYTMNTNTNVDLWLGFFKALETGILRELPRNEKTKNRVLTELKSVHRVIMDKYLTNDSKVIKSS